MFYCIHLFIPVVLILTVSFAVCCIPATLMMLFGMKKCANSWTRINATILSKTIIRLSGASVSVSGSYEKAMEILDEGKPLVFVSNHCSMMDIPVILSVFASRMGFVAKTQLAFVPFVNIFCALLNCVFINRKNRTKSVKSVRKAVEKVKNGQPMLIFPEGTRSKTGKISSFKRGSFHLATESQAVIVPLVIKGDRELAEDRNKFFLKKKIILHILEPVSTENKNRFEMYETELEIEKEVKEVYEQL